MDSGSTNLKEVFQKFFLFYDVPFRSLMEPMQLSGETMKEEVNLVLEEPSNKILREAGVENSDYDAFSKQNIGQMP